MTTRRSGDEPGRPRTAIGQPLLPECMLSRLAAVAGDLRTVETMYRLRRLGSTSDPGGLWLDYEWGPAFDNTEWRPCVDHFMTEVAALGHDVVAVIPRPPFRAAEDFVEIEYLIDGKTLTFSSDHLLSLIELRIDDESDLRGVWNEVGARIGWTDG